MRSGNAAVGLAVALVVAAGCGQTSSTHAATQATSITSVCAAWPNCGPTTVPVTTTTQRKGKALKPLASTTVKHALPKPTAPAVTTAPAVAPVPTVATVPVTQPAPTTPATIAPSNAAVLAAERARALQACLALAASNKAQATAANNAWYESEVGDLIRRGMLGGGMKNQLDAENKQNQASIQQQYTLDVSLCHIKYG